MSDPLFYFYEFIFHLRKQTCAAGMSQAVTHLPIKHKTLGSNPSTFKKERKGNRVQF
jgi:hypothetical protein